MTHDEAYWALKEQEKANAERAATRKADHVTSIKAAKRVVKGGLNKNQQRVMDVLQAHPDGLADFEIRELCNKEYGPTAESTYRKRRSELFNAGLVARYGGTRVNADGNPEKVWRIKC